MDTPQGELTGNDLLPGKQKEELHDENETMDCEIKNNITEIGNILIAGDRGGNLQIDNFNEMNNDGQSIDNSGSGFGEVGNLNEVPSMNLSDVYSTEKFGQDLLQFIEHGHSLGNWQHGNYQDTPTDSLSSEMDIESTSILPIQAECINADIQSTSESTLTLTVLNSTSTDDASQPISFSFSQANAQAGNLVDHDYCVYPKSDYSVPENFHESMHNSAFVQPEQSAGPAMDKEKLQRMKRRKEKNRECSRQFRLKQKNKEESLTKGKIDKIQELENLKRNVEKLKTTLAIVAQQCSSKCPKTRMLLGQYTNVDKENINPDYMQIME